MSFTNRHQGALITRDAHAALLDLKRLVDSAAEADEPDVVAMLSSPGNTHCYCLPPSRSAC